ncbi:hypothetical protein [Streptomyces fumanus]|uniref:hypothetical protein n=1 Tax=Streptomyces fumanus TaxID=67302 RepID=UPI0033D465F4
MVTIVLSGAVVLVVLGFGDPIWWLAAAALLGLYVRLGRDRSAGSSSTTGTPAGGGTPTSYRAYRERRDRQARWERRYRRERPFEARRQERQKIK